MQTVERIVPRAASLLAAVCLVGAASSASAQSARVAGFRPSKSGFKFTNNFPSMPYTPINIGGVNVPIGDASNGMCGGMVYAVRDYFEANMPPPSNTTPPAGGPLFNHLSTRLFDSFNLPGGPMKYLHLMNPALPDHETDFSKIGLAPRGRAWVTIVEEWPRIKADLDNGRLSPMALIRVKSHDPSHMGQNHQVLAYAYVLNGHDLKIYVYDPNYPKHDRVTISLSTADPYHTTTMTQSTGQTLYAFFQTGYGYRPAPGFAIPAAKLAGDFNADGRTDVALAGGQGWNTLPVSFSTGSGGFSVTNGFVGSFAAWAQDGNAKKLVGDFNGDGRADVALTGPGYWSSVPTAFSYGNGSFSVTNHWIGDFAGWSSDREVQHIVGDFNGDGRSDIALTGSPWWDTLPVAFSNGNGTYNVTNVYVGEFAGWSAHLEVKRLVGDFNGDGRDDIALTGPSGWASVPVAFSNGDGSFHVTNSYVGSFAAWSAHAEATPLVGDYDGDGRDDVALTGMSFWTSLPVAFSDGGGGFSVTSYGAASVMYPAAGLSTEKVTGDFNGDGRTDIAIRPSSDYLLIGQSLGNGTFTLVTRYVGVFGSSWSNTQGSLLLKGDFTGDGRTDLALTGPLGWLTIPLASAGPSAFTVTNGWVADFGTWASEPVF
jgi:hypothetical protein